MPKLEGITYRPFPFELLKPQTGTLTWMLGYDDLPVKGLVLEFPIPEVALPGDDLDEGYAAMKGPTLMRIEAPILFTSIEGLDSAECQETVPNPPDFGGSIYLGWRHHGIDLRRLRLHSLNGNTLTADVDCRVFFTHEGLGADESAEFDDGDWQFSANVVVQAPIQSYPDEQESRMTGDCPTTSGNPQSLIRRGTSALRRMFRPKG